MIQPNTPTTHAGYRIRPVTTQSKTRIYRRCGIDFKLNSRAIWEKQKHCRDCRGYARKDDQ